MTLVQHIHRPTDSSFALLGIWLRKQQVGKDRNHSTADSRKRLKTTQVSMDRGLLINEGTSKKKKKNKNHAI